MPDQALPEGKPDHDRRKQGEGECPPAGDTAIGQRRPDECRGKGRAGRQHDGLGPKGKPASGKLPDRALDRPGSGASTAQTSSTMIAGMTGSG